MNNWKWKKTAVFLLFCLKFSFIAELFYVFQNLNFSKYFLLKINGLVKVQASFFKDTTKLLSMISFHDDHDDLPYTDVLISQTYYDSCKIL